ncbi:Methyl-accepting chemotaxis protein [Nostoc flagelliforme CCNUN1]|uniref:Methyl-accepting chemotaxis protein n=1 Tax=Nostoc flagelliforme CCNUN1 TaxID=2038116 RepID=A0A2K8SPS2_9NOSO|nr:hypothetical protein [Nostoc flagelliforme]AUB37466.1 Methyl-accepting chemotaxis protein [Nostoc flagelliforme CCNUN1]
MTATITKPATAKKTPSPYRRLHVIIPIEDMLWASKQKSSVTQLWQECWTADPYGSRWMPLSTNLGYSTFIQAKKVLAQSGLFIFKPDKSTTDGRETVGWVVRNVHGSRQKEFWELDSKNEELDSTNKEVNSNPEGIDARNLAPILVETQPPSEVHEPSQSSHEHITNSSKEFVMCESSAPSETAIAPLEGATPSSVAEENVESPAATEEKWSDEARTARRLLRPMRQEKLKMAQRVAKNPGFDFLLSCWEDDVLRFVIRKLLVAFPQWGIACVDEELVNSNLVQENFPGE